MYIKNKEYNLLTLELLKTYIQIHPERNIIKSFVDLGIFDLETFNDPEDAYKQIKRRFDDKMNKRGVQ